MTRVLATIGVVLLVGCSSSQLDGAYTGAVSASGTCVPATITAVFEHGTLVQVDAGDASWNAANPSVGCTADVTDGNGMVECVTIGEVPCSNGGTDMNLRATLVLGNGGRLAGSFTVHEEVTSPPSCATNVTCDGAGTVTLARP
jgi:hypothetical protein